MVAVAVGHAEHRVRPSEDRRLLVEPHSKSADYRVDLHLADRPYILWVKAIRLHYVGSRRFRKAKTVL